MAEDVAFGRVAEVVLVVYAGIPHRLHAPEQAEPADGVFLARKREYRHERARFGQEQSGSPRGGEDGYRLDVQVARQPECCVAESVLHGVFPRQMRSPVPCGAVGSEVFLHFHGDGAHHRHHAGGVDADGCFVGEHDGVGSVADGVCDVRDFGAGGDGVGGHGVEHLGGGDDVAAHGIGEPDQFLLEHGHALNRHLDAQIAPRDHDPVRILDDAVDGGVRNSLCSGSI